MQAPKYLQDKLWRRIKQSGAEQGAGVLQAASGRAAISALCWAELMAQLTTK